MTTKVPYSDTSSNRILCRTVKMIAKQEQYSKSVIIFRLNNQNQAQGRNISTAPLRISY